MTPFAGFSQPELNRVMDAVVRLQERVEVLTSRLQAAGIPIPEAEPFNPEDEGVRLRQFERANDIDAFW